ncbi:MAG: NAD(P)/FAD-dependent oxidoreductase [Nitrososphaeria archaeon]
MSMDCDVIVAGGSFSGLFSAKELSKKGFTVKVFEEHNEIGYPNRCSGVVSINSLKELGILPTERYIQNHFSKIMFHSPSNGKILLSFSSPDILVLNRYEMDNFLAEEAAKNGAELCISSKITNVYQDVSLVKVKLVDENMFSSKYLVDTRGIASYENKEGTYNGIQSNALYKNFEPDCMHVFFDTSIAPGFFAWLIPIDEYVAKVGLGTRLQPIESFDRFLSKINVRTLFSRNIAPIIVGGPIEHFVRGRILYVGDSAGQTKPTTGGGIYFGGVASSLASEAFENTLQNQDSSLIKDYEKKWFSKFNREIEYMKLARIYFEKMENHDMEKLFTTVKRTYSDQINFEMDYDFHISSLIKSLGVKSFLSIAINIFGASVKNSLKKVANL